jgi:putative transposase
MTETIQAAPDALPIVRQCELAGASRATYYRHRHSMPTLPVPGDPELRQALHRIALETSGYGYRRMTRQLRREGIAINSKKVRRLMREEHLLYSPKRRFVVTTDSDHDGLIYANVAKDLKVTQIDRLWVADLTYVRLPTGFCYLAAIVDTYSRRCIGWAIESYLDARLPLSALEMAITTRCVTLDLVHHSDRGTQYASLDYTERLKKAGIQISMSRKGNPYDNAKAESFFKTVKTEEVYVNDYRTLKEARANLSHFLEAVYNQKRLHSSLDYLPPVEFEELAARQKQPQPIAVS